ncbi:MAG TPA: gamma-butyrobetaine hydroxylase-like domain-containing protein [Candidatus Binatia bacterium]|nr:gamma-butyrobetaine hydroxylase-like domain-containing protein [Candidatus Binatia bacterium]
MDVMSDAARIARLKEVGRYALGVDWADGHDSILPYRSLRLACPCDACVAQPPQAAAAELGGIEMLGHSSVFLRWADGHETVLLVEELRALCRCARCAGEPDYPLSGR